MYGRSASCGVAVHMSHRPASRCCAIARAIPVHYIVEAMMRTRSVWLTVLAALPISLAAQDRLRTMPGYVQAQQVAREGSVGRGGALSATWIDANAFEYTKDGKRYRYDVAPRRPGEIDATQGQAGN